jgi:hypothetical protein
MRYFSLSQIPLWEQSKNLEAGLEHEEKREFTAEIAKQQQRL